MRLLLLIGIAFVSSARGFAAHESPDSIFITNSSEWDVPTAAFTATTVCQSLPTVFTNNSTTLSGTIVASIWDFGDGQGSTVFSPNHVYHNSGTFSVILTVINSSGDVDEHTELVTVYPSGTLNFLISSPNKCVSSTFTFTNLSNIPSGNFTTYSWDFGDGTNSSELNASHTYASFGTYTITLATLTNNHCSNAFSKTLEVYPEATVDFNSANVCVDKPVQFINHTTIGSGLVSYVWNFGDTNTSSEINPSHTYATATTYDVILTATTEKGCVTNFVKQATTFSVPIVSFAIGEPCLGTNAIFTNQSIISSGTLTQAWNFGDGNTSTDVSPEHLYSTVGNFNASLEVMSTYSCKATASKILYVSPKPVVNFSFSDICLGVSAEFLNNTTVAEGDVTYAWNFGDTETAEAINPVHKFTAYGNFDVTLLAKASNGGCSDFLIKTIHVLQQPKSLFEVRDNCLGQSTEFTNTSAYEGQDISYQWNFGNGTTSTEMNPAISYTSSQTYLVSLLATSANGCNSTFSKPIKIYPLPQINFVTSNVCFNLPSIFTNLTTILSGTINYLWDFGNGTTSIEQDPTYTYTTPGDYLVKVTATSNENCISEKQKTVTVHPLPVTDFEAPPVCDGQPVVFANLSSIGSGQITEYAWDFGDQSNSVVKNPTKEFLKEGTYQVKLTSHSDHGCQTFILKPEIVNPPPIANFSVKDVCSTEIIQITNTSKVLIGSLTYDWDFGDNTVSTATSPSHTYKDFGVYNIRLIASSDSGCKDSVAHAVAIFGLPEIKASDDQTVSKGHAAQLMAMGALDYNWQPIEGLNNSNIANPMATPMVTTQYKVVGKDKYGCVNSDSVTVTVLEDFSLMASNVLTPDGNGSNDTWVVNNIETYGDALVRIYDRWGKLVYHQENYQNDWRGFSGGDILPDGTYYYYISFSGSDKVYRGALTILRNKE